MFQKQIEELRKLSTTHQEENEELEQYGQKLCLQIDGMPVEKSKTSKVVLKKNYYNVRGR